MDLDTNSNEEAPKTSFSGRRTIHRDVESPSASNYSETNATRILRYNNRIDRSPTPGPENNDDSLDCSYKEDSRIDSTETLVDDEVVDVRENISHKTQNTSTITAPQQKDSPQKFKDNPQIFCLFGAAFAVVLGIIFYVYYPKAGVDEDMGSAVSCNFNDLKQQYNQDEKLWISLNVSIESVLHHKPTKPAIFMFAYREENHDIINKIVERTAECLTSKELAIRLKNSDLAEPAMFKDYGVVLTMYKDKLAKSGVLLVTDLNKVDATIAQAFHVICDSESPWVPRSVIFLTMKLEQEPTENTLLKMVGEHLKSNWSILPPNVLHPLLTRVTDQVFFIDRSKQN